MTETCGVTPGRPRDERDGHGCGTVTDDPHWPTGGDLDGLVPLCWRCCQEAHLCEEET